MDVNIEFGGRRNSLPGGNRPASCSVDDYFKVDEASAFIVGGNFQRVALRFPDQLLSDAREVLRSVRSRVRKLETERKKRGEGKSGRSLMVIFIDSDMLDATSSADRSSERLRPAAVVDYGYARVGSVKPSVPVFYPFDSGGLDVQVIPDPRRSQQSPRSVAPLAESSMAHKSSRSISPLVDLSIASPIESFGDLIATVTTTEIGRGARLWLPQKILAAPGSLGSSLDTDQLLRICLNLVGSTEADNPPSMTALAIAAAVKGGPKNLILLRTQRALLEATVGYLWRATDHGGMVSASGLVVLPTALPPSEPYGGPAPAERRHPSPISRGEAPDSRREDSRRDSATKRFRVDSDEHGDKKMKSIVGGFGPLGLGLGSGAKSAPRNAGPGRAAIRPPPKTLLTTVTIPKQFSSQFNSLLALCEILERGKFMAAQEAAELVVQARTKVENLQRVSQLDPTLFEENRIMRRLLEGIDAYAMGKGPASVALYIHDKVTSIADPEREVLMAEVTADLERVRESMGIAAEDSDDYPAWDWGPVFGWPPTAGSARGGGSGTHGAFPAQGRNSGVSEGHGGTQRRPGPSAQYTAGRDGSPGRARARGNGSPGRARGGGNGSPGRARGSGNGSPGRARGSGNGSPGRTRGSGGAARGHRGGGHSHAAGAPRKPICAMCSRKGAPADHSFRVCPGTTCYKCGQSGHVAQACKRN